VASGVARIAEFSIAARRVVRYLSQSGLSGSVVMAASRMMHDEDLRPVLDRLLATRRAKVEETQGGTPRGLRVLFTGRSGRNKLLAAQLFAHELAVDLFEIDLSRIVSKYVSDTERNLDELFDAARASDAVLLFDDTDHLFASNGDDSGRFPNFDVSQLRKRIESYDGVVLLGTDDREHVDPRLARQCDEVVEL
jgi:SpoVK/Ycf46/Vps4 family AAA+-type ATPase